MKAKTKSPSRARKKTLPKKKAASTVKKKKTTARPKKKPAAKKSVMKSIAKKTTKKTAKKTVKKTIKKTVVKTSSRKKTPLKKSVTAPVLEAFGAPVIQESAKAFYTAPETESPVQITPPVITEQEVGKITHYYSHLGIGIVELGQQGKLKIGDTVHIKGHTTDFEQLVNTMEIEHENIQETRPGQIIGLQVREIVRINDRVYKKI